MQIEEPSGSLAQLIKAEEAHAHRLALAARADSELEVDFQQSREALKSRLQAERASQIVVLCKIASWPRYTLRFSPSSM